MDRAEPEFVTCAGCTCLCDDIPVAALESPDRIPDCQLARSWFARSSDNNSFDQTVYVDGVATEYETAIDRAASILMRSSAPLVCGLDGLATGAQFEAWKIADRLNATIDSSFDNRGRGGMFSLQRHGKVTATLGEVSSRSDLVIFWFCDPATTHPRLIERYCKSAERIIVIGEAGNATATTADLFVPLKSEKATSAAGVLRALISGSRLDAQRVESATGHAVELWQKIADAMAGSNYGALFYGHSGPAEFDAGLDTIFQLVIELNQQTRFVSVSMRDDFNSRGAENVLTASCGFPFAIKLNPVPQFNGLEFSALHVFNRGDCESALICSTVSLDPETVPAGVTSVVLSDCAEKWKGLAAVVFPAGLIGLHQRGDLCRLDGVLLPVAAVHDNELRKSNSRGADLCNAETTLAALATAIGNG